jgi:predicted transposase YbfD/YdcC
VIQRVSGIEEAVMAADDLVAHFSGIDDPRCAGKIEHRLMDVLVIAVCATIAGAESWEDMALYGRSKAAWLGGFLALPGGIPSHDTFRRVFMLIDPDAFARCFTAWAASFGSAPDREVVAIDGKSLRRSFAPIEGLGPLHIVSAWASERGLALGQRQVSGKSNEITAIPELLDMLSIEGSIVTLDAMGCQRSIAEKIGECGADYLIALKANQGRMFRAVQRHCEVACFARGATLRPACDSFDDSHGRLVRRRFFVCPGLQGDPALNDWPGLNSVLAVETIRSIKGRVGTQAEIRYFLASYEDCPAKMAAAIRAHWAIENSLHWVLDVTLREDECRVRNRTAAQNFAMLRKIALNLIKQHSAARTSLKARRKKAAWDNEYMLQVISGKFHA